MHANKFEIIFNGFDILKKNQTLLEPFFSILLVAFLGFIPLGVLIFLSMAIGGIINSSFAVLVPAALVICGIVYFIIIIVAGSFFFAGAIGMAKELIESGKTTRDTMWATGKACYINMILTYLLVLFIYAVTLGIIFGIPALIGIKGVGGMIVVLIFILAFITLFLALALVPYAVVIDNLVGSEAIKRSISFFRENKYDVLFIGVVSLFMDLIISLIRDLLSNLGPIGSLSSIIWALFAGAFSFTITIIWWTMLYTDKPPILTSEV